MDVVSPELNSLLPDEIMDTEAIEDVAHPQTDGTTVRSEPTDDTSVPMETDTPMASESLTLCSDGSQAPTSSTDSALCISSGSQLPIAISSASSPLLTLKPAMATSTATTKTTDSVSSTVSTSGLQKLTAPFTISAANHQIILNKVASSQATEAAKSAGTQPQIIKQEGQKLLVTAIGKSGQPIVLQLPHTGNKPGIAQTSGDSKSQTPQFKVVTIGGRSELKPVLSTAGNQLTTLQAQQLKTVQIAKKTPVSSAAPIKFIITKTVNSKGLSPQATVNPVIAGRVLTQNSPGVPQRTITLSEPHNATIQSMPGKKIAISPLKSPSKVTVVSVASPTSNTTQKSVALPVNVALGQQILTVQQSTSGSPVKVATSQTAQGMKSVQSVAVGGVGSSQFKTIIPLATQPNVQQIQVPGSRFHYVRLVTATTASSTVQPSGPSTSSIQTAKPMVVGTGAVRMSVPIVPAQSMKQVVPKPLTSAPQVVTTTQTQQRLIMPATPLPQIQPNFTNLPPGTVLAPAPGSGNVGYAVVPAQYVTQLQQSPFVTLASSSGFPTSAGIQTQARLPLNGLSTAESTSRPRKPCNCTKSQCLKLYCDCFANGEFCNNCNCNNCFNNLEHETERLKAIKTCLDRNPEAFKPKIGKGKEGESDRRHSKGCNCKRSGCLKNYCECYEAKIMCSSICKCIGCKNFEESPERKTLMHLADAAEVRVQQQTAAKTKLSSQISDLLMRTTPVISSGSGRLPYTFAELCRPFEENGSCKYGEKCQFAHGYHELRSLSRHPKYKTEPCRTFHTIGFCPYGPRCHFIHNADERRPAPAANANMQSGEPRSARELCGYGQRDVLPPQQQLAYTQRDRPKLHHSLSFSGFSTHHGLESPLLDSPTSRTPPPPTTATTGGSSSCTSASSFYEEVLSPNSVSCINSAFSFPGQDLKALLAPLAVHTPGGYGGGSNHSGGAYYGNMQGSACPPSPPTYNMSHLQALRRLSESPVFEPPPSPPDSLSDRESYASGSLSSSGSLSGSESPSLDAGRRLPIFSRLSISDD